MSQFKKNFRIRKFIFCDKVPKVRNIYLYLLVLEIHMETSRITDTFRKMSENAFCVEKSLI